jgi:hypothetical protein
MTTSENPPVLSKEDKEKIKALSRRIKVTKTVATRSVKGKSGDNFVGFAAAWDTVQEDAGHGLVHTGEPEESPLIPGMTLKEARLSALILGMQADLAAHDHAMAGGNISSEHREVAVRGIKHNYAALMADILHAGEPDDEGGS